MTKIFLLSSCFLSLVSAVQACPYCFIDEESPQVRSGEAGVLVLGGFVVFVLGVIATLAFQFARRAKALEKAAEQAQG